MTATTNVFGLIVMQVWPFVVCLPTDYPISMRFDHDTKFEGPEKTLVTFFTIYIRAS